MILILVSTCILSPIAKKQLLKKLEANYVVESICSIPLNCVITCHLWQILKGDLLRRYNKLTICHWAFEAHNDKFVDIIANQIWNRNLRFQYNPLFDRFSQKIPHDFAAEVYVIANTPECNYMEISFSRYDLFDNHLIALTNTLADKAGKLQVKWLDLSYNKLTDRGVTDLFQRAVAAFQSLKYLNKYDRR